MKGTENPDTKKITKEVISFVRGVADRLGDQESLAAAERVEIHLNAIDRAMRKRREFVSSLPPKADPETILRRREMNREIHKTVKALMGHSTAEK